MHAITDVELSVDRGSLVAVMGPSGSGKSTLLTIAGSLEEPTTGEVLIDGSAILGDVPQRQGRLRRRTIGYVFQDFNLLAGLTAAENVTLPLELDGVSGEESSGRGNGRARGARTSGPSEALSPTSSRAGTPAGGDSPCGGGGAEPVAR